MPAVTPVKGKFGGKSAWFLVDGLNLQPSKIQGIRVKLTALQEQSDGIGDGWEEHTPTSLSQAEFAQEGAFFDTNTGQIHAAMVTSIPADPNGAPRVVMLGFDNVAIGQGFYGFEGAYSHEYEVLGERGKLQRANVAWRVSGRSEMGAILHALTAETADATSEANSVDNATQPQRVVPITSSNAGTDRVTTTVPHNLVTGMGVLIAGHSGSTPDINGERTVTVISPTEFTIAVDITVGGTGGSFTVTKTANGGAAYLEATVVTLGSWTGIRVDFRHSADDSVFVDLVQMTSRSALGAERKIVAPGTTVNRYLAQEVDFEGAGSGGTTTYVAGFARA